MDVAVSLLCHVLSWLPRELQAHISTSLITGHSSTVGKICSCLLLNVNNGSGVSIITKHNGRARRGAKNNILFHTHCPI